MSIKPFRLFSPIVGLLLVLSVGAQTPDLTPLSPAAQELLRKGVIAAQQQDYLLAIRYFQDARKLAPNDTEIFKDLGLAESKLPGRELRSIAWFGAYLSADPNATNAAAVKQQIDVLHVKCQSNIARLIQSVQDAAVRIPIGDANAWPIPGTYHRDEALSEVAILWASFGDFENANNAIGLMVDDPLGEVELARKNIIVWRRDTAVDKAEIGDIVGAQVDVKLLPDSSSDYVKEFIASAQAKAGDIEGAFSTAESIQDANDRNGAVGRIADAQTKAGDVTSALKTINLNPQLSYKNTTLRDIVLVQVKGGDIDGALKTASFISIPPGQPDWMAYENKDKAYSAIADAQSENGDTGGALKTVEFVHGEQLKDSCLEHIAKAQIKVGDIEGAQKTVDSIAIGVGDSHDSTSEAKGSAQVDIANAQVTAGDIAGALKTLAAAQATNESVSVGYQKDSLKATIAGAHANAGDIVGAFKIADSIQPADYKSFALEYIVEEQAKAGDIGSALKTVDLLQHGSDANGRRMALAYIAGGQAEAGKIADAQKTADSIQDADGKTYALEFIVSAEVKAGNITNALKTADLIQDERIKAWAQSVITQAQAKTSSTNNQPAIVKSGSARYSAQAAVPVVQVSDWLKILDDGDKTDACPLNTRPFLDLAGLLTSLPPSGDSQNVFSTLNGIASNIVKAERAVDKMLKQQAAM